MKLRIFLVSCFIISALIATAQTPAAFERAGDNAMEQADYYSASSFYYSAYVANTASPEVTYKLADACRLFNDYENAEKYYTKAYALDRDHQYPLISFYLAEMKQRQGDYAEAAKIYSNYLQMFGKDSSYYTYKAHFEMESCNNVNAILKDTVKADIQNLGTEINSVYSDFAAQYTDSTRLVYSSLRFLNENKKTKKRNKYIAKIQASENEKMVWSKPKLLSSTINVDGLHACNSAVSSNNTFMIYTQCNQVKGKLMCELYLSTNKDGEWAKPLRLNDSINLKGFTATMPCIANRGIDGYTLYFVSDRPGGMGKLDIWKSDVNAEFHFSNPVNAGAVINTIDDDITPFYDNLNNTLYFSSDGHHGLGGFDVYKVSLASPQQQAINVGYPINTSYNDLYFTAYPNKFLLSSNRPGSMYIKARTCCYDIYEGVYRDTIKKKDSVIVLQPLSALDSARQETARQMDPLLPMKLYFDNDQPDPKTMLTVSRHNYVELYTKYVAREPEFVQNYSAGIADNSKMQEAKKRMSDFFANTVRKSFNDLDRFSGLLLKQLEAGDKIEIAVRGSASPLAASNYNQNLSKRRISSVMNYWKIFDDGKLYKYISNGTLKVVEEPVGEDMAGKNISDDLKDTRNSVYSPAASSLRYIEVIRVLINGLPVE
ncbi:MAG: tetratricopeptide repeat protein [Bacteroidetes bacterium]|jgi:hypothetical protein|nr:tetratricopeptide repeat protein [Bacteroidota bacterium]